MSGDQGTAPPLPPGVQDPEQLFAPPYSYESYGPDKNCTLSVCPVELSLYKYIPSLAANICFILFFGISMVIHIFQGVRYRTWSFLFCLTVGCVCEMIGYGGRILLHQDPFSFNGFLLQIILVTFAPVFFTAGIYFTLARLVRYLGQQHARFPAKFYYWVFIPCDVLSLILQAVGGASSSTSSGTNQWAINVSLAGLAFQVFTLCVFIGLSLEYAFRYRKARKAGVAKATIAPRFKVFIGFLSTAIVLILIRCIYRIDELSNGYSGPLIHDEGLFVALEGVMVLVAVYCLNVGHPGWGIPPQALAEEELAHLEKA